MKKNDIFPLLIEDMGTNGEGIGHFEGMTFFVKDALIGDEILAGATKLKKGYGYARVIEVIKPSPFRVEPACPVAKACGGCQLQALSYKKQLELKFNKVYNNLKRIGGFSEGLLDEIMEPIVGMDEPFRYRNKAQFPAGCTNNGTPAFGFYAAHSHNVIEIDDCKLGVAENTSILGAIRTHMIENNITAYDEATGHGLLRHVLIRKGFTSGQLKVCLVINGRRLPQSDSLIEALTSIPGMHSISLNVNTENTNRILGDEVIPLWGDGAITDTIRLLKVLPDAPCFSPTDSAVSFSISPKSFYQVNPVQTEKLYSLALEYAQLTGTETVWDLYCGIGTISLFLAQKAKQVYGVEIVPEAIEDAKRNASLNGITNAEFFVGKAEEVVPAWVEAQGSSAKAHPDVIVVDPPRKGCDSRCLETILAVQPKRIVYVSCDSATLARDLRILSDGGYSLTRVRPVDQFPHTVHVECAALLSRSR